jgi:hypothetical protein
MLEDMVEVTDEIYFAEMKTMFRTRGWEIFLAELSEQALLIGDIQDISTLEKLHFAKGQLSAIGGMLSLEETIKRSELEGEDNESPQ